MQPEEIRALRTRLKLTQQEFAQILNVHWVTVSNWERGASEPDAYRVALMHRFERTIDDEEARARQTKQLLLSAGVVAVLAWLLGGEGD